MLPTTKRTKAVTPTMNDRDYLDFDLEIGRPIGQAYPLTLLRSPAGEARATVMWPFGELALENRLKDLQIALLSSGGVRRTVLTPAEEAVQRFGAELFELLFSGEVRNRYDVSQERVHHQEKGLRIKLRIQDPRLANLPWEFLYDPRKGEYLALSQQTPVVRYLELPQTIRPLAVTPPLRILGMIAAPDDRQALDVQVEQQRLERAVAPLQDEGLVELHWLEGATWRDLQRTLRREMWHVFHFVGHGMYNTQREEGLIAFCNDQNQAHLLTAGDLGRLLADHRTLRLAVLNA
ncbi:MAG: CHAT domain-containing protein, partial [Caldilineaceae bacterium]|nr:CHAT domain-containing protein [Caldilineaceae bacterium]